MAYKPTFGTIRRDFLWSRECTAAWNAGRGRLPICNLCDTPVNSTHPWDESHDPAQPRVFGGKSTGVAHRSCNHRHGYMVVKPLVAKCERVRKRHLGLTGPGRGRHPMPAGKRSNISKCLNGKVVSRLSGAEKHARAMRKRRILTQQGT
jgi:hypothetical protein